MTRVVTFEPAPDAGDTVTMPADGAPALVLHGRASHRRTGTGRQVRGRRRDRAGIHAGGALRGSTSGAQVGSRRARSEETAYMQRLPTPARNRAPAVRVTTDPRCPACAAGRLHWTAPGAWTCSDCGDAPDPSALATVAEPSP